MKKRYRQLTLVQRYQIQARSEAGNSQQSIATAVGCSISTISRELRRCPEGKYRAENAHQQAMRSRHHAEKSTKRCPRLMGVLTQLLSVGFSPAAIAGRIELETKEKRVSHETLYQWIYLDKREGGDLHHWLLRAYRGYRKRRKAHDGRGLLADRVSITERPASAESRRYKGHWEGDTVHGQNGNLVTLVDRKTRYLRARKTYSRTKDEVGQRLIDMMSGQRVKSLTVDNGREFFSHKTITEKSGVKVYFADPYASWQRGSNEHANGLLRRYFPKGCDFSDVSAQQLRRAVEKINRMPRKLFGWKTAYEMHYGVSVALIT